MESKDVEKVDKALQTIRKSDTIFAIKLKCLLKDSSAGDVLDSSKDSNKEMLDLLSKERNRLRVDFIEQPVQQAIAKNPLQRPDQGMLEQLEAELKAEVKSGNESAKDRLEWVQAQLLCSKISSTASRQEANRLADTLVSSIIRKDNTVNQHALSAAISLIGSNRPPNEDDQWGLRRQLEKEQTVEIGPSFFTQLNFNSPTTFKRMLAADLQKKLDSIGGVKLTAVQLYTLCMGLQQQPDALNPQAEAQNKEYIQTVEAMIRRSMRDGNDRERKTNAETVATAMYNGATGLGPVMMEADRETLTKLMPKLVELGTQSDKDAMILLAAIASDTVAGDLDMAVDAAKLLCKLATKNQCKNLELAVDIVSKTLNERGDNGVLLETLGNLSFLTESESRDIQMLLLRGLRCTAGETARLGPSESISKADYSKTPINSEQTEEERNKHRLSASLALFSDLRQLDDVAIQSICANMTMEMVAVIHAHAHDLDCNQQRLFMNALRDKLDIPQGWSAGTAKEMERTLLAFAAFAPFARPEDANMIQKILSMPIKDGDPRKELEQTQKAALVTMFALLDSPSGAVRSAALEKLEQKEWPPALIPTFKAATADVMKNAGLLPVREQERIFRLIPGSDAQPSFALMLSQLGVSDAE
ncbi:MAG: hypothetical protein K2Z81_20595, partial [Cyanobacteria bacterium]|nr:hypothetical protein [Cyanobacteriota bacterium]